MLRFHRLACCALLLGTLGTASAQDVHQVPGDFATIQEALAAASDFDVIVVAPGTWTGPLDTQGLQIELRSAEGPEVTIVEALGAPSVLRAGVPGKTSTASIRGFTFTGGIDGVVTDGDGHLDLSDCIVRDNAGVGGRGAIEASHCTFQGNGSHGLETFDRAWSCTFVGNGGWGAMDLSGGMPVSPGIMINPSIEGSRFLGNGLGGARFAVASTLLGWEAEIRVANCLFVGDSLQVTAIEGGGVGASLVRNVTLVDGTIKLLQGALDVTSSILLSTTPITDGSSSGDPTVTYSNLPGAWLPGTGNIDADPLFADPDAGDYTLVPGSPCINSGNPAYTDPDLTPTEMGAFRYETWTNLGGGTGGFAPLLQGKGGLIAGQPISFSISPPIGSGVWLFASVHELGVPFKGGILWPSPDIVLGPLFPGIGDKILAGPWPAGLPAGFSFVVQAWWPSGSPGVWSGTNGLRGVQP